MFTFAPFCLFWKEIEKILEISNNGRGNIRHCSSQYSNQVDFNGRGQSLRDPAARRVLSSSIRFCRINKTKNIPRFYEETSATRRIAPLPTPSICYFDVGRVIRKCNKMEINRNYLSIANVVPFLNYYFYQYFLLNFAIHHFTLRVGKWKKKLKNAEEREGNENEWRKNEHVERINAKSKGKRLVLNLVPFQRVPFCRGSGIDKPPAMPASLAQSSLYSNGSGGSGSASSSTFGPIAATFHLKAPLVHVCSK